MSTNRNNSIVLEELLALYRGYCVSVPSAKDPRTKELLRKKELRYIADQLEGQCSRLTKIAHTLEELPLEIQQLNAKRFDLFCGASLSKALQLNRQPAIDTPPEFHNWPTLLRSYAEILRTVRDYLVSNLAVDQDTPAQAVMMVFLYCYEATGGRVTYQQIADVLNEATHDLRSPDEMGISADAVRKHVAREDAKYRRRKREKQKWPRSATPKTSS
jgi:hypothetical protein